MSGSIPTDLLEIIAKRARIMEQLRREPADKRKLESLLDVSRTTIDRAIDSLSGEGCIERRDGVWEITLLGRLAFEKYEQLTQQYEGLTYAQPILQHLSTEAPLDVDALVEADIVLAEIPAPHEPINRLGDIVENSEKAKVLAPVFLPKYIDVYHQLTAQNIDTELILNEDVAEYMWTNHHSDMGNFLQDETFTMWKTGKKLPFGLVLLDMEAVWVGIHDDDGGLKGAIINNTASAVKWAKNVFQRYREQGRRMEEVQTT